MNICLEYIQRNAKSLMSFPCNFFVTREVTGERVVVSIDKKNNNLIKREWELSKCNSGQALPPMSEKSISDIFECSFAEFTVLDIKFYPLTTGEDRPSQVEYNKQFDKLFSFDAHDERREIWLWNSFLMAHATDVAYFGNMIKRTINFIGQSGRKQIFIDQQFLVKTARPKLWKFWLLWKRYLLKTNGFPAEIWANNFTA